MPKEMETMCEGHAADVIEASKEIQSINKKILELVRRREEIIKKLYS